MESEKLIELMEEVEKKGIAIQKVEEKAKASYAILKLYMNSGPVPVTIIKNIQKLLEEGA